MSPLLQLAPRHTVQGCIFGEFMATCVNLTDPEFELYLPHQKDRTSTTKPSNQFGNCEIVTLSTRIATLARWSSGRQCCLLCRRLGLILKLVKLLSTCHQCNFALGTSHSNGLHQIVTTKRYCNKYNENLIFDLTREVSFFFFLQ